MYGLRFTLNYLINKYSCLYSLYYTKSTSFPYLTAAAAIGVNKSEIDLFIKRLNKTLESIKI